MSKFLSYQGSSTLQMQMGEARLFYSAYVVKYRHSENFQVKNFCYIINVINTWMNAALHIFSLSSKFPSSVPLLLGHLPTDKHTWMHSWIIPQTNYVPLKHQANVWITLVPLLNSFHLPNRNVWSHILFCDRSEHGYLWDNIDPGSNKEVVIIITFLDSNLPL